MCRAMVRSSPYGSASVNGIGRPSGAPLRVATTVSDSGPRGEGSFTQLSYPLVDEVMHEVELGSLRQGRRHVLQQLFEQLGRRHPALAPRVDRRAVQTVPGC